jgi:S1-C subfamily serine protease
VNLRTVASAAAIVCLAGLLGRWVGAQERVSADSDPTPELRGSAARGSQSVVRVRLVAGKPLGESVRWALFRQVNDRRAGAGVVVGPRRVLVHEVQALYSDARYQLTTASGRTYGATIEKRLTHHSVALLRSDAKLDAPQIRFGSSTSHKVGNLVLAVGDPFGLARDGRLSVSLGVLEGRIPLDAREVRGTREVLLTSAALNPGSEGGALLDLEGRMIGLLAPLAGDRRLGRPGAGTRIGGMVAYALPVEACRRALATANRPDMGFHARAVSGGVLVVSLTPKGLAARAGLQPKDTIVAVDRQPIRDTAALRLALERPGPWVLVVVRDGKRVRVKVSP